MCAKSHHEKCPPDVRTSNPAEEIPIDAGEETPDARYLEAAGPSQAGRTRHLDPGRATPGPGTGPDRRPCCALRFSGRKPTTAGTVRGRGIGYRDRGKGGDERRGWSNPMDPRGKCSRRRWRWRWRWGQQEGGRRRHDVFFFPSGLSAGSANCLLVRGARAGARATAQGTTPQRK
jgi:hypothetical protein